MISSLTPIRKLWAKLGWSYIVIADPQFPLGQISVDIQASTWEVVITYTDRRDGTTGSLSDPVVGFPSETLIASFLLLVGPIDGIVRTAKEVEHEQAERRRRWEERNARRRGRR